MAKWILAFLGFQFIGFFGAIAGYFIGSAIDRSLTLGVGAVNPFSAGQRQQSFLKTAFTLMGALAKADGHISRDEVNQVDHFITQMGMTSEHRKQAIDFFNEGSNLNGNIDPVLNEFKQNCGHTRNLNQVLLSYLIAVALADGVLHNEEQSLLQRVAASLGFSAQEFEQLIGMIGAQDHFGGGAAASEATLDEAYKALGVQGSDDDKDIKRAYRKLMSKYHPDKLMGQGLPADMIKSATERSQEIQAAYDLIKKNRANN